MFLRKIVLGLAVVGLATNVLGGTRRPGGAPRLAAGGRNPAKWPASERRGGSGLAGSGVAGPNGAVNADFRGVDSATARIAEPGAQASAAAASGSGSRAAEAGGPSAGVGPGESQASTQAAAAESPNPAERMPSTPMAEAAAEVGTALGDSTPPDDALFGSSTQRGPSSPSPGLPDFFRGA